VLKPESILSDNGSQFNNELRKRTLSNLGIVVKYSAVRHPESNPSERIMRGLGTYCKIYCHDAQKVGSTKWEPKIADKVLLLIQAMADAARGTCSKFIRPYAGPFQITGILPPATYELSQLTGKIRGRFNKKSLKPFAYSYPNYISYIVLTMKAGLNLQ
jgi:transposase InsO family protein